MAHVLYKRALILVLLVATSGCGHGIFSDRRTNPVLEGTVGRTLTASFDKKPIGMLATSAERRIVIVRIDEGTHYGRFCAEPPPDAAESIAKSLAFAIEGSAKTQGVDASLQLTLTERLATVVQRLIQRSQGLQLYRDGMYNLCQSALNETIDQPTFLARSTTLLDKAVSLVELELTLTGGALNGPPQVASPVLDMTDSPTGGLAPLGSQPASDWIPANRMLNELIHARQVKSPANQQVALVELYDVLVDRNVKQTDQKARTLSDAQIRHLLTRLRQYAKDGDKKNLAIPSQLKDKTQEQFLAFFDLVT